MISRVQSIRILGKHRIILMFSRATASPLMNRRCCVRGRSRILFVVLVFCGMMVGSRDAQASCGDYLFRHGKPVSAHLMSVDRAAETALIGVEDSAVLPGRPCSGPSCQGSRIPVDPIPAVPVQLLRLMDSAVLLEQLAACQAVPGSLEIPQSERGAAYEPGSVFLPPESLV